MKNAEFRSEMELAEAVVGWLKVNRWDVYQEVAVKQGPICDIVAKMGSLVWAIETKLRLGPDVLDQARYWLGRANWVSVATPYQRNHLFYEEWMRYKGIGWLSVRKYGHVGTSPVDEVVSARIQRIPRDVSISRWLNPAQQDGRLAGSNSGGYYTPFKGTCDSVTRFVHSHPGVSLKSLVDSIPTHYGSKATARSKISHFIENGVIKGIRVERTGRQIKLFPAAV
jgi:hypothetical protein